MVDLSYIVLNHDHLEGYRTTFLGTTCTETHLEERIFAEMPTTGKNHRMIKFVIVHILFHCEGCWGKTIAGENSYFQDFVGLPAKSLQAWIMIIAYCNFKLTKVTAVSHCTLYCEELREQKIHTRDSNQMENPLFCGRHCFHSPVGYSSCHATQNFRNSWRLNPQKLCPTWTN